MKPETKTALAEKLDQVRVQPSDAVWAAIEAKMDAKPKKKGAWFPFMAAATVIVLVGISGILFMEKESNDLPITRDLNYPTYTEELPKDLPDLMPSELSRDEVAEAEDSGELKPIEAKEEPKVLYASTASPSSKATKEVETSGDVLDPINNQIGGLTTTSQPKNNTVQVVVKQGKKKPAGQPLATVAAERLKNVKPSNALAQIKNLKNPDNWNLDQVDLKIGKLFGNTQPEDQTTN